MLEGLVEQFVATVAGRPEVLDCFATPGEADYHLRVLCRGVDAYSRFLEHFLFRIAGVQSARTILVLREIKHEVVLPV